MKIVVKFSENIKPSEVVKKVMADKNAFKEAITNGTVSTFAKNKPHKRKAFSIID
jgi:hypothetical protein